MLLAYYRKDGGGRVEGRKKVGREGGKGGGCQGAFLSLLDARRTAIGCYEPLSATELMMPVVEGLMDSTMRERQSRLEVEAGPPPPPLPPPPPRPLPPCSCPAGRNKAVSV